MQRHAYVLPSEDGGVSDYEGVGSGILRLQHHSSRIFQFFGLQEGVEGYENPRPEAVGVGAEPAYVVDAVAGRLPRPEIRRTYIYCIGTAVNGRDADFSVSRRSEKLKMPHYLRALRSFWASGP